MISRFNMFVNERLYPLMRSMFFASEIAQEQMLRWVFQLIRNNLERLKPVFNNLQVSSLGFLLTILYTVLKIYFEDIVKNDKEELSKIQLEFSEKLDFFHNNFDKLEEKNDGNIEEKRVEFNMNTKLFFSIHILIHLTLDIFKSEYAKLEKGIHDLLKKDLLSEENDKVY